LLSITDFGRIAGRWEVGGWGLLECRQNSRHEELKNMNEKLSQSFDEKKEV
jgi:hypothetical protein